MADKVEARIVALMPVPRWGPNVCRDLIQAGLKPFGIPLAPVYGVFWGPSMQRAYEWAQREGVDWILSIDGDSVFTPDHLQKLLQTFASRDDIDALAGLQMRRGDSGFPLLTHKHGKGPMEIEVNTPLKVETAHFGLTLLDVAALRDMEKPWFFDKPDEAGGWGEGKIDADIWFWQQWREAGKSVWVHPGVSLGHVQEMVSYFDDDLKQHHVPVSTWRERVKA